MNIHIGILLGLLLLADTCRAGSGVDPKKEVDKINYSVGYQIGGDFLALGVELNSEALLQGIRDALGKNEPLLPRQQMNSTLVNLKQKIVAGQKALQKQHAAESRQAGADFLKNNAGQKGVTVLPSGVQYLVLTAGTGKKPTLKDDVDVHYRLTRVDGTEIGSTYTGSKPRTITLSKAVPGLQEVLPLMAEGSRWKIVFPAEATAGAGELLENRGTMIYEMELLSVKPARRDEPK